MIFSTSNLDSATSKILSYHLLLMANSIGVHSLRPSGW